MINSGHSFREAELAAVNYLLFPRLGDWAVLKADRSVLERKDPRIFLDPAVVGAGYFDESWQAPATANRWATYQSKMTGR